MVASQSWDPERYARNARFVADLGMPAVELLDPKPGERILDLGCGDGVLTAQLVKMGCHVVGVDSSKEQVEAARTLGIDVYVMDGQELTFDNEFDAVFSNAALHWMKCPEKVVAGVQRALKPGGRFIAECGGYGCVQTIVDALTEALKRRNLWEEGINPWYFPTDKEYHNKLSHGGFDVSYIALIDRPTQLPGDIRDWLGTFAESFTSKVREPDRTCFVNEACEIMKPILCDKNGVWTADYIRLRFSAVRPL